MDERSIGMLQMVPGTGGGDVGHERIRAHGEASDRLRMQFMLPDQIVQREAGKSAAFGMQRGSAAIDVVVAVRAGGESEISQAKGEGRNQVEQRGARIGGVGHRSLNIVSNRDEFRGVNR